MAKHVLKLEADVDFDLVGICSHHPDYRLCWALNDQLRLRLTKANEPFCVSNKKGGVVSEHSFYEWFDEVNHIEYYFIKNKGGGKYLIPEEPQIDYFLVLRENNIVAISALVAQLKQNSGIITALEIDAVNLKSADKLIF
ncbi:MAG: IPExxxVDY family protein [Lishizhenia sp.]